MGIGFSRRWSLVLVLTLALATAAAPATAAPAWWPFGQKAPAEPVPDAVTYTTTLVTPDADRQLAKALKQASGLISQQKTPASGLVGLIARARQDIARLTAVLYENARYGGEIAIAIDGRPLASLSPFDTVSADPVPVTITVTAGPQFVFGRIATTALPDGMTLDQLGLTPGAPARSSLIVGAEVAIAEGWQKEGHPLARIGRRETVADHRTKTLDVALAVDPGPVANFGRVSVEGTERVDPTLVAKRAGIGTGLYSSTVVKRARSRLLDLGVFDSVRVTPAAALDPDGTIPIVITVGERKRHVIGASVSYSNTEGAGAEVYWRDRNVFGGAEQLRFSAAVSRLFTGAFDPDYRLAGSFKKPAIFDPMTDFTLSAEGYQETTAAYRVRQIDAAAGLTHIFSDTVSGSLTLEEARSRTTSAAVTTNHLLTTLTGELQWDTRDNPLDPTRGFRALVSAAPAYDAWPNKAYATFRTDFSAYHGFGPTDRFVLAGRVAAAVITVDNIGVVAEDRRLYAGGAGSVRGYAYQNIAPRDASGNIVGGRSMLLASAEARYRINDQFGVVAFVDAGNAYASVLPTFDNLKVGVGAGLRYLTPVGPLRFDVAVPLLPQSGDPTVAFYVGLGQAF